MSGFAKKTKNTLVGLSRGIQQGTANFGGPVGQLAGAAGIAIVTKDIIQLDAQLGGLLIQSRKSQSGLNAFKNEVLDVGLKTGQTGTEVAGFIDAIVERTGDLPAARRQMNEIAKAATGTRTEFALLGAVTSNLKKKFGIADKDQFKAIDILNVQAKAGAVGFNKLAPVMERVTAAVARLDGGGLKTVRTMGALIQSAIQGTGEVNVAATSIAGIVRTFLDPKKAKEMRRFGFNPIDVEATRKAGRTVTKDLDTLIKGIVRATKGDEAKLGPLFGEEAIKGISRIAQVFRQTGGFEEFDDFASRGGDATETLQDFNDAMTFTTNKLKVVQSQAEKTLSKNLAGPIELLNSALTVLANHPIIVKGGIAALLGVGALGVGLKGLDILTRVFKGGKGLAGKVGLPGGGIPVRVTNTSGLGLGGPATGAQKRARLLRSLGGAGGLAKKAGLVGLAGAAGFGVGTLINDQLIEGTAAGDAIGKALNQIVAFFGSEESRAALAITVNAPPGSTVETSAENTSATVNRGDSF